MINDHPLPIHSIKIKKLKSLLTILRNSVRSENHLFRNLYADENGKEIDILENGQNSCAAFVSWILLALGLIKSPHSTVFSTEKDLKSTDWYETKDLRPGSIIVWEVKSGTMLGDNKVPHPHMGFYVGDNMAISNDSSLGYSTKHHYTYDNTRKIDKIYWHPELDKE